jgi:hypothetical protein
MRQGSRHSGGRKSGSSGTVAVRISRCDIVTNLLVSWQPPAGSPSGMACEVSEVWSIDLSHGMLLQ